MILFNDVIEIFPPDHLDWDRATKALQHLVDRFYTGCVSAAFVDDDLAWQPVNFERAGKKNSLLQLCSDAWTT